MLLVGCPQGMTTRDLATAVYDAACGDSTVRSEASRRRRHVGPWLHSENRRVRVALDADFASVERPLREGRLRAAARAYRAPLLPASEARGVVEARDQLDAWVRSGVMTAGDRDALWAWLESASGRDDLPAWKRFLADVELEDPRRPLAQSRGGDAPRAPRRTLRTNHRRRHAVSAGPFRQHTHARTAFEPRGEPRVTKRVQDIDDPRLVKALAHPVRVRILGILEHRTATPKELAAELALPLENTSYHVRALREFGFIKLEHKRQVRGAIEHHYSAVARPRVSAKAWEEMPESLKQAMNAATVGQLSDIVNRGVEQGKFSRPESQLQRMPYTLDEEGFSEASAILTEALARISEVERGAKERIERGQSDPVPVVTAVMLFDRPDPPPLRPSAPAAKPARDSAAPTTP